MINKKRLIGWLIEAVIFLAIAGLLWYYRVPLQQLLQPYISRFWNNLNYQLELGAPCQKPITFSLGQIDPRFKVSETEAIAAINEASAIWSSSIGKQLFAYSTTSGALKVNFVYDYRQETADKLKKLGIVVETSQKSYEELKAKYDVLNAQYKQAKAELQLMISDFDKKQAAYNKEVAKWNKQGGAPKNVFDLMNQTAISLNNQLAVINAKTDAVNALVENLNTTGEALNRLIAELNLNVDKYNTTGEVTGKEFQAGVYVIDEQGRRIEVYEFGDRKQLIRLLAHELGHALGLEHSSGKTDIMYYLNEAGNEKLTDNDLTALKSKCRIK